MAAQITNINQTNLPITILDENSTNRGYVKDNLLVNIGNYITYTFSSEDKTHEGTVSIRDTGVSCGDQSDVLLNGWFLDIIINVSRYTGQKGRICARLVDDPLVFDTESKIIFSPGSNPYEVLVHFYNFGGGGNGDPNGDFKTVVSMMKL